MLVRKANNTISRFYQSTAKTTCILKIQQLMTKIADFFLFHQLTTKLDDTSLWINLMNLPMLKLEHI